MPTTLLGRIGESRRTSAAAYRWPVKEIWPKGCPSIWATWPSPSRTPKDMPWGEAKRTMRTTPRLVGADGRSGRAGVTSVCPVSTGRMEAFSDGVIAILITVMVLELPIPHGTSWAALREAVPVLLSYVLSFVYLGIYWNNHHHMLQATHRVTGLILWANLHLLFWLSLTPFATAWLGENEFAATPAAAYGIVLLAAALAYFGLQTAILRDPGA